MAKNIESGTPSAADEATPLMKQYGELKAQAGDALLFFRMGDFYELFHDDAVVASRVLELTLTSRDKNKATPTPMAGVPHHSAQSYIQRLLRAGHKVGIAEQLEDPASVKGKTIVKRGITRIFTPAVQFDHEGSEANYLATAIPLESDGRVDVRWVLACLDASTGEALVGEPQSAEELCAELPQLPIRHFVRIGHQLPEAAKIYFDGLTAARAAGSSAGASTLFEDLPSNYLSEEQAQELLRKHYGLSSLSAFITTPAAERALGILVTYALRTQLQEKLAHLRLPQPLHRPKTMILGPRTAQHLDLIPGPDGTPNLYQWINRTRSALGARQLKRWLLEPLKATDEISARQTGVRELWESQSRAGNALEKLAEQLSGLYDLERISGRINAKLANPRDTLALGRSLATLPRIAEALQGVKAPALTALHATLTEAAATLAPLSERILRTQREDAPLVSRDGGIFALGTSPELDRLITLTEDGQRWLIDLETQEREKTGIPSLKVRYNRVFGYYIEITQSHLKNVPAHYQRKQTTVGAERFFTEELKKFEDEIVTASTRQKALEQQLFEDLVQAIQAQTQAIMEAARALGELDSLQSLARLGDEPGWTFPVVDDSMNLEIEAGRHPLVDTASRGSFVPNDTRLSDATRLTLLITGPNMGGKSTVMRQVALILILGQVGAPVPAARARWGSVSSLYTRIGAHDAISRGQSTFMVEMSELAHILHHADERSFIILDEIGRGTSTYDGMSVAWSTLEWICREIRARTLFATHYHELTRLEGALPLLANAHMAVEATRHSAGGAADGSTGGTLRFLYQLKEGPANESFGVHVARLAGLPAPVIERAWAVLEDLEKGSHADPATGAGGAIGASETQLSFFGGSDAKKSRGRKTDSEPKVIREVVTQIVKDPVAEGLVRELGTINLNETTPLQALTLLATLQGEISKAAGAAVSFGIASGTGVSPSASLT